MKRILLSTIGILFLSLIFAVNAFALASGTVEYEDGRFSIHGNKISFLALIKEMSSKADIDIYIVDSTLPEYVTFDFSDRTMHDTFREVLRGCSYAVVYGVGDYENMVATLEE